MCSVRPWEGATRRGSDYPGGRGRVEGRRLGQWADGYMGIAKEAQRLPSRVSAGAGI